ncbi:MAG: hypothetical protein M1829_001313 [Trizodia sp. TS-e1964]|nr:MAG: hypothetical protein M1829_001313 [Trizodia sp. TS-e1964]
MSRIIKTCATVYELGLPEEDERPISRVSTVHAFKRMIEGKTLANPSLPVFLQGHQSPAWLNTVGYLCNVDPEFLLRHQNFRIPPKDRQFISPALPLTSSNIIHLLVTSKINHENSQGGQVELDQLRKDAEDEMKEYSKNLKRDQCKNGRFLSSFIVFHEISHSTSEQDISISVNEFEKDWVDEPLCCICCLP